LPTITVAEPVEGLDSSGELAGEAVGGTAVGTATEGDAAVLVQAAIATAARSGRNRDRVRMVKLLRYRGCRLRHPSIRREPDPGFPATLEGLEVHQPEEDE
jgi:hypothetical protein